MAYLVWHLKTRTYWHQLDTWSVCVWVRHSNNLLLLTNSMQCYRPNHFSHYDPIDCMIDLLMHQPSILWKSILFDGQNYMKRNRLDWIRFPNEIALQSLTKMIVGLLLIFYTSLGIAQSCWCTHFCWFLYLA